MRAASDSSTFELESLRHVRGGGAISSGAAYLDKKA